MKFRTKMKSKQKNNLMKDQIQKDSAFKNNNLAFEKISN